MEGTRSAAERYCGSSKGLLLGRQVSQRWPNGLTETKAYDSASRLLAITPGQQDKKGAPTITYAYDQRGNRLTMDRSDVGLSTYTYDEISQLLTAALPDGDFQTYTFDPVGNRLSLKDSRGLQTYEYDEADELLEVESDFNPEQPSMVGPLMTRLGASDANRPLFKTTYGWDADGNQVSKTGPGNKATSYTFDALDRLVGVSAPGSEPEKYLYNADRQRIATVRGKDAVAERFLHLGRGRQILGDPDGNGKLTKRYILQPSGQLLAHVDTSANRPAFYHFDALGSTVVMSDSANRVTTRFVYDPYGARRSIPETEERYGFVGSEAVGADASGLLHMGARHYDPHTGSFLSREPLLILGRYAVLRGEMGTLYATYTCLRVRTDDRWTYDEVGNVTRAMNAHETADYSYDQRDWMNEAVYPDIKMRVGFSYDLAGRMSGMSYPGGEIVRYERDAAGRVTAIVDSVAGRTEMGYDLLGRQVSQRWPNGLSETSVGVT
jgi:RHS repeat-associated protein